MEIVEKKSPPISTPSLSQVGDKQYVIYWGNNKDGSPAWEHDAPMEAGEQIDPSHEAVAKFVSEDAADLYLEEHYPYPEYAEVLELDHAKEIYLQYTNK